MSKFRNFMTFDETNLKALKLFLTWGTVITLGTLFIRSCNSSYKILKNTPRIDPRIQEEEKMTLIDKNRSSFYFDTDDNTNTTEIIAKNVANCCWGQEARIHDAKIGTVQSFKDWKKDLFCENCGMKNNWIFQKVRGE